MSTADSHTMTRLRVLSGDHAGASIDWDASNTQTRTLGPDDNLDIYIGDWSLPTLRLTCAEDGGDGGCDAHWDASADEGKAVEGGASDEDSEDDNGGESDENTRVHSKRLSPWMPVRFASVILCIGPANEPWPSDAELLDRLYTPKASVVEPSQPVVVKPAGFRGAYVMVIAGIAFASLVTMTFVAMSKMSLASTVARPAAADGVAADAIQAFRKNLTANQREGLDISSNRSKVVVRGVVASREAALQLNQALDKMSQKAQVSSHVMSADEVIELVRQAVATPGVVVKRDGPRSFSVEGASPDPVRARDALDRLQDDLDMVGVRLEVTITKTEAENSRIAGTLIDESGASFVRTRDGIKHIVSAGSAEPDVDPAAVTRRFESFTR